MARALSLAVAVACGCSASSAPVTVQVLAFNDFHGALDPTPLPVGDSLGGGAALLAAHVARLRTAHSVVVSAGDLVGASPLASGLFHDEPTIDVMNALGLDYNGVGNHEFDEGAAELLRLQQGGCHPVDGCAFDAGFSGARFRFLAANVFRRADGQRLFPAYEVRDFAGAKVAFVGLTLRSTPAVTLASAVTDLEFRDEVETVNALVPEIRAQGAKTIVVLLHQGGRQLGSYDDCLGLTGPIVDLVQRFDDAVRVVVSGHSHTFYNCEIGSKQVSNAGARGTVLTDVRLSIDVATQTVRVATAHNLLVTDDIAPDPAVAAIVARASASAAPLGDAVVGSITGDLSNLPDAAGELPMGDVVADAMRDATGAPVALMNRGGIRAGLLYARSGAEIADGQVTFGELFAVQPFGNALVTVTISGAELEQVLEASLDGTRPIDQVAGLSFRYDPAAPVGARIDPADILVAGAPWSPSATYRVTTNSILADDVSGHPELARGADPLGAGVDIAALVGYFKTRSPIAPPTPPRMMTK